MSTRFYDSPLTAAGHTMISNLVIDQYGAHLGPHGLAAYVALCRHADTATVAHVAYFTGMTYAQAVAAVALVQALGLWPSEVAA